MHCACATRVHDRCTQVHEAASTKQKGSPAFGAAAHIEPRRGPVGIGPPLPTPQLDLRRSSRLAVPYRSQGRRALASLVEVHQPVHGASGAQGAAARAAARTAVHRRRAVPVDARSTSGRCGPARARLQRRGRHGALAFHGGRLCAWPPPVAEVGERRRRGIDVGVAYTAQPDGVRGCGYSLSMASRQSTKARAAGVGVRPRRAMMP